MDSHKIIAFIMLGAISLNTQRTQASTGQDRQVATRSPLGLSAQMGDQPAASEQPKYQVTQAGSMRPAQTTGSRGGNRARPARKTLQEKRDEARVREEALDKMAPEERREAIEKFFKAHLEHRIKNLEKYTHEIWDLIPKFADQTEDEWKKRLQDYYGIPEQESDEIISGVPIPKGFWRKPGEPVYRQEGQHESSDVKLSTASDPESSSSSST